MSDICPRVYTYLVTKLQFCLQYIFSVSSRSHQVNNAKKKNENQDNFFPSSSWGEKLSSMKFWQNSKFRQIVKLKKISRYNVHTCATIVNCHNWLNKSDQKNLPYFTYFATKMMYQMLAYSDYWLNIKF